MWEREAAGGATGAFLMVPHVVILAYSPAPYRVELFDAVAKAGKIRLTAVYLHRNEPGRHWEVPEMAHHAIFLSEGVSAEKVVMDADLLVVSYFAAPVLRRLWRRRKGPWAFWGERPGAHRRGVLGRLARRVRFWRLFHSQAPIWAIGQWAVEAYRSEFGGGHAYHSLPYFSDLERFRCERASFARRVLFSGSQIPRKGVDVLRTAFERVRPRFADATLTLAGPPDQFVSWEELPALYARHDILCVPSRYDGWGMVVPEGLASGMPVIATEQMGAAREFIREGENGWLARAGDVNSLAQALEAALSMNEAAYLQCSAAATAAVAGHTLQAGARRLAELCEEALKVR